MNWDWVTWENPAFCILAAVLCAGAAILGATVDDWWPWN